MSYKLGRPKRAAEDYARSHHDSDFGSQPSKKPRFDLRNPSALAPDALEEDAVLEADVIGKRGQQVRRNAVNVDGYDSDSDNENFDTRAKAKASAAKTAAKSKDEDEHDMFADLDEDFKDGDDSEGDADRKGRNGKKAVRFLDEDEIEGQVHNSKSGGHVSADLSLGTNHNGKGKVKANDNDVDSSSDSDVDDETRADAGDMDEELGAGAKKQHAPKLDAFNMKSEQEEGRFDDQGNYVRKATDPDAVHDNWLEGLSKKDMKKAKEAHDKREYERRQKDLHDDAKPTSEILSTLLSTLETGETILEALARFGKGAAKKPKKRNQKDRSNGGISDQGDAENDIAEAKRKATVESITEAADLLLSRGQPEIYDTERELLLRQYRRETGEDWAGGDEESASSAEKDLTLWEYRWSDARDGGDIHGPYDGGTMKQWNDAGYFGEAVEFRRQNATTGWSRLVDF